ncbi:MAG: hypothetical protein H8D34_13930 [Chloroflexi bacterium]|nr:hypothetical protein [Chloroflexota bacterium]
MNSLQQFLDYVAAETVLVHCLIPERYANWLEQLTIKHSEALYDNNTQLASLLGGIQSLLRGTSKDDIKLSLDGIYATCWENILEGISNFDRVDQMTHAVISFLSARDPIEQKHVLFRLSGILLTEDAVQRVRQTVDNMKKQPINLTLMQSDISVDLLQRSISEGIESAYRVFRPPSSLSERTAL